MSYGFWKLYKDLLAQSLKEEYVAKKGVLLSSKRAYSKVTQWVMYLEIPPFGEDTNHTSMNGLLAVGLLAVRLFAFWQLETPFKR